MRKFSCSILLLLLISSGCAIKMNRHGYRVRKGQTLTFKYDGVFMSDKAMSNMMGKRLENEAKK